MQRCGIDLARALSGRLSGYKVFSEVNELMCAQGTATLALEALRLLVYNLLQLARHRHLCRKAARTRVLLPWRWLPQAFQGRCALPSCLLCR